MGETGQPVLKHKNFRLKKILLGLSIGTLLVIIAALLGGYMYVTNNLAPVSGDSTLDPVVVEIPKGANTNGIGIILVEKGLIKNARFFSLYARYKKLDGAFRSGEYRLNPNMDLDTIMNELRKGQGPITVRVTIPEGYSTKQIVELLSQQNLINKEKFMTLVRREQFNYEFLRGIPESDLRLEGYLFPATYDFPKGSTEKEIIELMLKRFEQELTPEVRDVIAKRGWTIQKLVIMASIIEKEAQKAEDRPVISGVFQNRLAKGMPLQSCATIQFLLGYPKPVLYNKDLEIKSPYNTYKNPGLPPGPIANPGSAALQAAANPQSTEYLYFVAKPDGYHAFAKTFEEHLRNQQKYQQ